MELLTFLDLGVAPEMLVEVFGLTATIVQGVVFDFVPILGVVGFLEGKVDVGSLRVEKPNHAIVTGQTPVVQSDSLDSIYYVSGIRFIKERIVHFVSDSPILDLREYVFRSLTTF
jgi:hypothetical protein